LIKQSADACTRGDPQSALKPLDREFTMSFLASPLQTHAAMARDYQNLCQRNGPNSLDRNDAEIDDVSLAGDVAAVRIRWSTHMRSAAPDAVRRLGELQVWRRTLRGWRLWRSARWPLPAPKL
jgi:hypothetical protein